MNLAKRKCASAGQRRAGKVRGRKGIRELVALGRLWQAGGGFCNVAHFVCNFLVNIIGNNEKIAQLQLRAGADNARAVQCGAVRRQQLPLKCVSELNIPWSAVAAPPDEAAEVAATVCATL